MGSRQVRLPETWASVCTRMRIVPVLFLALAGCSYQTEEYDWFEANWVSDTEATMEFNRARGVTEEAINVFRPIFGRTRWEVVGRTLTFVDIDGKKYSYTFRIKTTDGKSLTLVQDHGNSIIERTASGFCLKPPPNLPPYPNGEVQFSGECFRQAGT